MKKGIQKIKKKLSGRYGFSLGELLAATIILLLASQVLAEGVAFAVRMYNESLTRSYGKQLCSTLTATIETELRYTTDITYDNDGKLRTYFSPAYGKTNSSFLSINETDGKDAEADSGEIAIQITNKKGKKVYQRLVSKASYSSYDLKAKVESATYTESTNSFQVTLSVTDKDGKKIVTNEFDVLPVNQLKLNA